MNIFKRIRNYYNRNFAIQLSFIFIASMFALALIFQTYLQRVYVYNLTKQVEQQKDSILEQESQIIENQLNSYVQIGSELSTDNDLYLLSISAGNEQGYGTQHLAIHNRLEELTRYSTNIINLAVVHEDRVIGQFDKNHYGKINGVWYSDNQSIVDQLFNEVVDKSESKEIPKYVMGMTPNRYGPGNDTVIHLAYPIIGNRHSVAGYDNVLIATFRLNGLNNFLSSSDESSSFEGNYITDGEGNIVYSFDPEMTGINAKKYYNSRDTDILTKELGVYGLDLNIAVNTGEMEKPITRVYLRGLLLYLVLLAILAGLYSAFMRKALLPVREINAAMEKVRNGSLNQKIAIHGEHEIWQLAVQYNQMVDSLQKQINLTEQENQEKLAQMERAADAEKEALESQINAHFLCNTLNAINYDALDRGEKEISLLLRKLSNILRYTFSHQYESVSIAQEMAWVDQYLYLQKFRLMDVFDYEIDYAREYDEWPCCKLFLQPFVENSIYHGFEGRQEGGLIMIKGEAFGEFFKVTISDNGNGMSREKAEEIHRILSNTETEEMKVAHGIGIQNACARLRMFYGDKFSITMETAEGKGTAFILLLPIPQTFLEDT